MGWNSWDCFGTTVTEDEVIANIEVMAERLLPFGWEAVVVDIQWYDPTARAHGYNDDAPLLLDAFGIPQPAPNRFPSSSDGSGFTSLAARVHELGLQFGLHIMRGIPKIAVEQQLPVKGAAPRCPLASPRSPTSERAIAAALSLRTAQDPRSTGRSDIKSAFDPYEIWSN